MEIELNICLHWTQTWLTANDFCFRLLARISKVIYGICSKRAHARPPARSAMANQKKQQTNNQKDRKLFNEIISHNAMLYFDVIERDWIQWIFTTRQPTDKNVSIYVIVFMMSERDSSLIRRRLCCCCRRRQLYAIDIYFELQRKWHTFSHNEKKK